MTNWQSEAPAGNGRGRGRQLGAKLFLTSSPRADYEEEEEWRISGRAIGNECRILPQKKIRLGT